MHLQPVVDTRPQIPPLKQLRIGATPFSGSALATQLAVTDTSGIAAWLPDLARVSG